MSMKLFELRGERKEALDRNESILARVEADGNRAFTDDERSLFDANMNVVKSLTAQIEPIESRNTVPSSFGLGGLGSQKTPTSSASPTSLLPSKIGLRAAMESATQSERGEFAAFAQYLAGDQTALADLRPSGDGGVFIPTMVAGVVARNYYAFTPVRNAATVWPTQDGDPTTFPVISDSEVAVILPAAAATGADATVSGNAPPTAITGPMMSAYKFSSKPIFCPRETITDAALNVVEELLNALLARIARTQNLKYTKGAGPGSNEPTGFITGATSYAAGAVPLDLDIALDLAYSVPAMYRPSGLYMASDSTIKYLRKLKTGVSGDKRSLWKEVFEEGNATLGTPALLHGYPLIVNNDMDSVAADGTFAGVSPLAFGEFKKFVVREVESGAPYVYRYSVPALDGGAVIAFSRSDSKLVVPTAISKLTVS